jgi:hypothetical protein
MIDDLDRNFSGFGRVKGQAGGGVKGTQASSLPSVWTPPKSEIKHNVKTTV